MQKVKWEDKLLIDELKSEGDIFVYLGGALQYEEGFGVDWRKVLTEGVSQPPLSGTTFDPTSVEPKLFKISIEGWDTLKRELKRDVKRPQSAKEFYKNMSRVVHLDLYALSQAHIAVFKLSQQRTHGTTEEYVEFVLRTYKRPTLVLYDDEMEDFSDWMLQRGLEARNEYYIPFKIFPTTKRIMRFLIEHKEDIIQWDENYRESMEAIRAHRAFARRYWRRKKGLTAPVITKITQKLTETYQIGKEVKEHLQKCESILAVKKARVIRKRIEDIQRFMQTHSSRPRKK